MRQIVLKNLGASLRKTTAVIFSLKNAVDSYLWHHNVLFEISLFETHFKKVLFKNFLEKNNKIFFEENLFGAVSCTLSKADFMKRERKCKCNSTMPKLFLKFTNNLKWLLKLIQYLSVGSKTW